MINMKQQPEKSKAQNENTAVAAKRTVPSNKTAEKKPKKTAVKQASAAPVPNGIESNTRKRKLNVQNSTKQKKTKSEENVEDTASPVAEETVEDLEQKEAGTSVEVEDVENLQQKESVTVVKAQKVVKSKNKKGATNRGKSTVGSQTAVKRQKVLLEVPKLPEISGVLLVMGENDIGQLGLGQEIQCRKRPTEHNFPFHFVDIAAGGMHSVGLTSTGEVYTFGCNDDGALGRPTEDEDSSEYTPRKVDIPDVVVKVSAGDSHSAALTKNGQVYIWGNFRSDEGPIGLTAGEVKSITPVRLLHNITVVDIASGCQHFVCLSNEGIAYTCGCAEHGQLGRVTERSSKGNTRKGIADVLEPKMVPLRQNNRPVIVSNIWTGAYCTFLKCKTTGTLYGFGLNNFYQLGLPLEREGEGFKERGLRRFKPERIESFLADLDWQRISGGQHHTLGLDSNGKVYSLGEKHYGRLGLGEDCEETSTPTLIPTLADRKCIDISCGSMVSFSVTEDGSVYSWGPGTSYQLGHGNDEDCYVPKCIEGNFRNSWHAFRVSGGGQHALVLAYRRETTKEKPKAKN